MVTVSLPGAPFSLHVSVTPFSPVRFVPVNVSVELMQELCPVCVSMADTPSNISGMLELFMAPLAMTRSGLPPEKREVLHIIMPSGPLQMYVSVTPEVSQTTLDEMAGSETGHCPAYE